MWDMSRRDSAERKPELADGTERAGRYRTRVRLFGDRSETTDDAFGGERGALVDADAGRDPVSAAFSERRVTGPNGLPPCLDDTA
jgi:hypothetical protein